MTIISQPKFVKFLHTIMSKCVCKQTEKGAALKEQQARNNSQKQKKSSKKSTNVESDSSGSSDDEQCPSKHSHRPNIEHIELEGEESDEVVVDEGN